MSIRQSFLGGLIALVAVITYLSYNPLDETNTWISWAVTLIFLLFGYLIDMMFSDDLAFVFDPNPENWRRKTDPQT